MSHACKHKKAAAKDAAALEARIMVPLLWWAEFLGLTRSWVIDTVIVDKDEIDISTADGGDALAEVTVQVPYHRALIEVSSAIKDYPDVGVERCMLHELLHVVFTDISAYTRKIGRQADMKTWEEHVETLCDVLSFALLRLKYGDDYRPIRVMTGEVDE